MTTLDTPTTRAVLRMVQPGNDNLCARCGTRVKFQARMQNRCVIANVYVGDRWDHLEWWHEGCYEDAGDPHGRADDSKVLAHR